MHMISGNRLLLWLFWLLLSDDESVLWSCVSAVVVAVAHKAYSEIGMDRIVSTLRDGGVVVDVKSFFDSTKIPARVRYWSL